MSLNYDYRTITAQARKHFEAPENMHKMDMVIWATIPCAMGKITKENYREFYSRYLIWNRMANGSTDNYLKLTDIYFAIGLSTNVFTETMAAFKKTMWERCIYSVKEQIDNENVYDEYEEMGKH